MSGKIVPVIFIAAIVVMGVVMVNRAAPRRAAEDAAKFAEVLRTAHDAVDGMEGDGSVTQRSCDPNEAHINPRRWRNLPSDRYREIVARSLALLCEEQGHGRSMTVRSADDPDRVLGRYHGNDRFEVVR